MVKVIDAWLNVNMAELGLPDYLVDAAANTFKQGGDFFKNMSLGQGLDLLDESGVERAIVTVDSSSPSEHVLSFVRAHPDRFSLGVEVDPRRGMKAVRELQDIANHDQVVLARVVPFYSGIAPSDAIYFPVYAKCVELNLPISINTGIPGPAAPGECQDPMQLDKVAIHFPELRIIMAHGADPWWDVAARLMIKYRNLYLMTSAYLPKYLPPGFVHFMNTRGQGKVIFASDHPAIPLTRCLEEARALPLRPGVLEKYLYENAQGLFFSGDSG